MEELNNISPADQDERLGNALAVSLQENSSGECLSDEDMIALIDGSISVEKRDRFMKHVASCSTCYDTFSLILELQERNQIAGKPRKIRLTPYKFWPLAAGVMIAILSFYVFFTHDEAFRSPEQLVMQGKMEKSQSKQLYFIDGEDTQLHKITDEKEKNPLVAVDKEKNLGDKNGELKKRVEALKKGDTDNVIAASPFPSSAGEKSEDHTPAPSPPKDETIDKSKTTTNTEAGGSISKRRSETSTLQESADAPVQGSEPEAEERTEEQEINQKQKLHKKEKALLKTSVDSNENESQQPGKTQGKKYSPHIKIAEPTRQLEDNAGDSPPQEAKSTETQRTRVQSNVAEIRQYVPSQTQAAKQQPPKQQEQAKSNLQENMAVPSQTPTVQSNDNSLAMDRLASVNSYFQASPSPLPAKQLERLFRETLELSKKLKPQLDMINIQANRSQNFESLNRYVQQFEPAILVATQRDNAYLYPNIEYFLTRSAPNSLEYRFFKLARSGWCAAGGSCYSIKDIQVKALSRIQVADSKELSRSPFLGAAVDRDELLKQWQELTPQLSGVFKEIALQTIIRLKKGE